MTAAAGDEFGKFRKKIRDSYTDLIVVSGNFSADTGMKEIIMSARKIRDDGEMPSRRGIFVTLDGPLRSVLEGACVGAMIRRQAAEISRFEGAPHGGTRMSIGDKELGTGIDCSLDDHGGTWLAVDTMDHTLHQIVAHLRRGQLHLPRLFAPVGLETTTLGTVAEIGPSHLQIRGQDARQGRSTSYSGPFNVVRHTATSTYPALWNNDSRTQQTMALPPDSALEPRRNYSPADVDDVWRSASNTCINIEARTTSQALMAAYVETPVVGGSAWPSITPRRKKHQKGLVVWCNSTLGILCRWSISKHQQAGRSRTSRTSIPNLVVPAPRLLERLGDVFDEFSHTKLDRMVNLWKDHARIRMDDAMLAEFGIDGLDLDDIRRKLCAEPSMNGGKMPVYADDQLA